MLRKTYLPPPDLEYPESDGEPIAESTLQLRWIFRLYGGISALFEDDPNVFVASDLFWYPVKGEPKTVTAPDLMVAFGRPQGERRCYKQWEEDDVAPQVVIEVLSHNNRSGEMSRKFEFYDRFGVEEYFIWDPHLITVEIFVRTNGRLQAVKDVKTFRSPRLGISFELTVTDLIVRIADGGRLLDYREVLQQRKSAENDLELQRQATQQVQLRAEMEKARAEQEKLRAEQESSRAEQEKARADKLLEKLKQLGVDPSSLD